MLPLVSVVIPVFNAGAWIGETLQTVIAQTYPRSLLEVIVVDDGSTDDSQDVAVHVLARSALEYRMLRNRSPMGPSAARNAGWRSSHGQWIQFLDADDLLEPSKIELQSRATEGAGLGVAALHSKWGRLHQVDGKWQQQDANVVGELGDDPILAVLKPEGFIHSGSQLFSRAWLERIGGFDERHCLIEDVDLQVRLLTDGGSFQAVNSSHPLFWYRQRCGSLSRADARGFIEGCLRNAKMVEAHWRDKGELTPARSAFLVDQYYAGLRSLGIADDDQRDNLIGRIFALSPSFLPPRISLRVLSRVFGYRRAEMLAVRYRDLKGWIQLRSASP